MTSDIIFSIVVGLVISFMIDAKSYSLWVNIGMGLLIALFCFLSIYALRFI